MSDYVVPLTSPVQLTNIDDIHAVDLHVRYCELVKAYEQLVGPAGAGTQRLAETPSVCGRPRPGRPGRLRSRRAECLLLRVCVARDSTLTASLRAGARPQSGQEGLRAPGPGDALGHVEGYGRLVWARGACGRGVPPPHAAARQRQRKLAGSAR